MSNPLCLCELSSQVQLFCCQMCCVPNSVVLNLSEITAGAKLALPCQQTLYKSPAHCMVATMESRRLYCCLSWLLMLWSVVAARTLISPAPATALLVVDAQPCFMQGGSMAVPLGDTIVDEVLSEFAFHGATTGKPTYDVVAFSLDCHPVRHMSFLPGIQDAARACRSDRPLSCAKGGQQGPWPPHCVQGTAEAQLHPRLRALLEPQPWCGANVTLESAVTRHALHLPNQKADHCQEQTSALGRALVPAVVVLKGVVRDKDAHSAFFYNADCESTGDRLCTGTLLTVQESHVL
jgi:nicotinamidase-related amidase